MINTPLDGLLTAHQMMKNISQNPFKCLRYMALSEGRRVPRTGIEKPIIVLGLCSSFEVRSFAIRQLGSLPSFTVYIQRRRRSREREKKKGKLEKKGESYGLPCEVLTTNVMFLRKFLNSNYDPKRTDDQGGLQT